MGPYYLSALVHMLGPVRRVTAAASRSRSERVIGSGPRAGTRFHVEVETHVTGTLEHASGALTTLTTSFDVVASTQPRIEIHGTEGSIIATDPNVFSGDVRIRRHGDQDWSVAPASAGYQNAGRGAGVADLAENLAAGRPHRASAELALHVLDIMQNLLTAAREHAAQAVATSCPVPDIVPLGSLGA
jgi:predicted dehydrogenase